VLNQTDFLFLEEHMPSPSSALRVSQPLAIAMWDFSWLERRWPGAGYEDWNVALDELAERGYNAVRIDAYPHFLANDPTRSRTLQPCWTTELWGSPFRVKVKPWPALPEFIRACASRGIRVALSTWWREDADRLAHRISGSAGLAQVWGRTLELLEGEGLFDHLLYVDLSNEWPTNVWTPFYQPSAPTTQEMWDAAEPMALMREAIGQLRARFPSLPLTFSTCTREDAWLSVKDASFLDLADHHVWLSSMEFYRRIDYKFEVFSEEGYDKLKARARALYESDPHYWRSELARRIDLLVEGSIRTGLPLVNTEGWSLVTWKDGPGMDWDWLLDITDFALQHATASGLYAAICTSNFCGPQYVGMWREVAWHRRQTDRIKTSSLDANFLSHHDN
jgi:hypothetical protein